MRKISQKTFERSLLAVILITVLAVGYFIFSDNLAETPSSSPEATEEAEIAAVSEATEPSPSAIDEISVDAEETAPQSDTAQGDATQSGTTQNDTAQNDTAQSDTAQSDATPENDRDQQNPPPPPLPDRERPNATTPQDVFVSAPAQPAPEKNEVVPNQVVLQFSADASEADKQAYINSVGGTVVESIDALNTVVIEVDDEQNVTTSEIVVTNEPDYFVSSLDFPPNDPFFDGQWGLNTIAAPNGWEALPDDAPTITVAVIDSGICDHLDLTGRVLDGYDFLEDDTTPQDAFGHGCAVASIIASNIDNGLGIAGVAPNAQIMPLRILDAAGLGTYSDLAAALVYATDNGAQIINLSLGGVNSSTLLQGAVNYALQRGVTVIAAVGNTGTEGVLYPAKYDGVIGVGAIDPEQNVSSFSTTGPEVDILAPGRDILTLQLDGGYALQSGTSFAAPHVAGIAAMEQALGNSLSLNNGIITMSGEDIVLVEPPTQEDPPTETVISNSGQITGWLSVNHGDPPPGFEDLYRVEIVLTDENGQDYQVLLDRNTAQELHAQRVVVSGTILQSAQQTNNDPILDVDEIQLADGVAAQLTGSQPWIAVLCKFSDVPSEPHPANWYSSFFSNTYPAMDNYWRALSYNNIDISGSGVVTKWYNLPNPRSFYIPPSTGDANLSALANDCAAAADADVYYPDYVGIHFMFNETLDCCAWGGSRFMFLDGIAKSYRTTWLPPWSQRHSTLAHEMGHGFGWPHSTGPADSPPAGLSIYVSDWDVMSSSNGTCAVSDSKMGCLAPGTITYHLDLNDWIPDNQITTVDTGETTTVTLEATANATTANQLMIKIPINDSTIQFYTVEVRDQSGYDQNVPGQAVIIHDVDKTRTGNGGDAYIVDAEDGNNNVNDAGAMWLPGETFYDSENNIRIEVVSQVGDVFTVNIENNPNAVPKPILVSPENAVYLTNASADFDWEDATATGLTGYDIRINNNSNPDTTPFVVNQSTTQSSFGFTLPAEDFYYWHVRTVTNTGVSEWSSRYFILDTTAPTVSFLEPQTDAILSDDTITMQVEADDTGSGMFVVDFFVYFDQGAGPEWVYVGSDFEPDFIQGGDPGGDNRDGMAVYELEWTEPLATGQNVNMFVYATDNVGLFSFTQISNITIDRVAPVPTIAASFTDLDTMAVTWSATDDLIGVNTYDVEYSEDGGAWNSLVTDTTDTSNSFTGQNGKAYQFRARANDFAGNISDWVTSNELTVEYTVVEGNVSSSGTPLANIMVATNTNPVVSTCTDAQGDYQLQFAATNQNFKVSAAGASDTCGGSGTTYLQEWWQEVPNDVAATELSSTATTHTAIDFTLSILNPEQAVLVAPLTNTTDDTPLFEWEAAQNVTRYLLWVSDSNGTAVINQWFEETAVCTGDACSVVSPITLATGNYNWWIRVGTDTTLGPWSDIGNFTLLPPVVATGTPSGNITETQPTFTWSQQAGVPWYYLLVTNANGVSIVREWVKDELHCANGSCSFTPNVTLEPGPHSWWVRTWNNGVYGDWSTVTNFNIDLVPGVVSVIAPTGQITEAQPTYSWNTTVNATWYNLRVDGDGVNIVNEWYREDTICNATTCSVTPTASLGGGDYTWWVRSFNEAYMGEWSNPTIITRIPPAPVLASPTGTINTVQPAYTWSSVEGVTWYQLEVQINGGGVIYSDWHRTVDVCGANCSFTPTVNLSDGENYQWRVRSFASGTTGNWSGFTAFSYAAPIAEAPPVPEPVVLIEPDGDNGTNEPRFRWYASNGATDYAIVLREVATDITVYSENFAASAICAGDTCETTLPYTLSSGAYEWWVIPRNTSGDGLPPSNTLTFVVP